MKNKPQPKEISSYGPYKLVEQWPAYNVLHLGKEVYSSVTYWRASDAFYDLATLYERRLIK